MNFLLKIVDGPMKGAEIALVAGTRVKVGSSDSCDIVIADASLASVAFELDVAGDSVMLITPDGSQRPMKPFEVCDFGTTDVAIGPADGPWGELTRPSGEQEAAAADAAVERPSAPESEPEAAEPPPPPAEPEEEKKEGGKGGCLLSLVILLIVLAVAAWLLRRYWPKAQELVDEVAGGGQTQAQTQPAEVAVEARAKDSATIPEIAEQYGLRFSEVDGVPMLSGNLKRRTERMAIRALAKASDPRCKLDVTDDETMLANSKELVFAYTDGAINVLAATNRVIALGGYAPSPGALARTIRALNEDIRGIDNVDTTQVTVGGAAPADVAATAFVQESAPEQVRPSAPAAPRPSAQRGPTRSQFNIAGILTVPYPCVVLHSGHRVMEGAQIGSATLVKIEAEKLVMKDGDMTFEWTP